MAFPIEGSGIHPRQAASMAAMSIFVIFIMAAKTRWTTDGWGEAFAAPENFRDALIKWHSRLT